MKSNPLNNPYIKNLIDGSVIMNRLFEYEWENFEECRIIVEMLVTHYFEDLPKHRQVSILNAGMDKLNTTIEQLTDIAIKKYGNRKKVLSN